MTNRSAFQVQGLKNQQARRNQIVQSAHDWLGTPYVHQASSKGNGCDCLGLVRAIWRELCGQEPIEIPDYSIDEDEWQAHDQLKTALQSHFIEIEQPLLGCILLFRLRANLPAKHLGILVCEETNKPAIFIHAQNQLGVCKDILNASWQRRLVGCFDLPMTLPRPAPMPPKNAIGDHNKRDEKRK